LLSPFSIIVIVRRWLARIFDAVNVELGRSEPGSYGRNGENSVAIGTRCHDGCDQIGD
jgi:hypothetical protein